MILVQFTNKDGEPIFINPEHVTVVLKGRFTDVVEIGMASGCGAEVRGWVGTIAKRLAGGGIIE